MTLLQSGAVWSALIALLNVLAKIFLPNLPTEVVAAVNALLVVVLAALGINVNQRLAARNK
jgi:hypothetical protein